MSNVKIFIAPPGAKNKKDYLFREMMDHCSSNDFSSVTYLAPNAFVLAETKKRFFSFFRKINQYRAYIPFESYTPQHLAMHLTDGYRKCRVISDRFRAMMFYGLLNDSSAGYALYLSDLFKKIRHYMHNKDLLDVSDMISGLIVDENVRQRSIDAIALLKQYESIIKENQLLDTESALIKSIELIHRYIHCAMSAIDIFFDPTPLEREMLNALIESSDNACILVEEHSEFSAFLQEKYEHADCIKIKGNKLRKTIDYFSYSSVEDEIEGMAKGVKKRIIDGARPWEMTVTFPHTSKYLPMLRRIFKKHGIPYSTGNIPLTDSPQLVLLEELLTCINEDYPRNSLLAILTSPWLHGLPQVLREWAVSFSYKAGIIKGKKQWRSLEKIMAKIYEDDIADHQKEIYAEFQQAVDMVIDIIEDIKHQQKIKGFADAFESALQKFGFFDPPESLTTLNDIDISAQIRNSLDELRRFADVSNIGITRKASPAVYISFLIQDQSSIIEDLNGIRILPIELAASIETEHLFFGGVTEGDIPSRPPIDPILPEKIKKDLGLPSLEYYINRQKRYFMGLLNISSYDPSVSFPSADGDKVFLPSPFLDWERSVNAPRFDVPSEEDVLIDQGLAMRSYGGSHIFWQTNMPASRDERKFVHKRISEMTKGMFSVTLIDYYRKCPLRFYIEKILDIDIERPPKFEVDFRLWGLLSHRTMEILLKDRDMNPDNLDEKLMHCLERSLHQFPVGSFWKKVARQIFAHLLPLLREQEREIRDDGFIPCEVEQIFSHKSDRLRLKGKIDRVDKKITSTDANSDNPVILLDYKTGSLDDKSLQLPLYAWLWRKNRPEPVEKTGYYSLKEGRIHWYPTKKGMDEFINDALTDTEVLIKNMKKGYFAAEPERPAECRFCYHSPLCQGTG